MSKRIGDWHSRAAAGGIAVVTALSLAACQPATEAPPPQTTPPPEELRAQSEAFAGQSVTQLMGEPAAMQLAEQLFTANCGSCHGAGARDARGVMDLSSGTFNYGFSEQAIRTTIADGRQGEMPAMGGRQLGEVDLGQLVAYVQSLGAGGPESSYKQRGKQLFAQYCAGCHGEDGRGMADKGAPNLTDGYWQNGSSMMNIRLAITRGVQAQCPAQAGKLTATEMDLLTAFVLNMVDAKNAAQSY